MSRPSVTGGAQASAYVGSARVAWLDRRPQESRCAALLAIWPRAEDGALIAVEPKHRALPMPDAIAEAVASFDGAGRRWVGVVTLHGPEWRALGPALVAQIRSAGWTISEVARAVIDDAAMGQG